MDFEKDYIDEKESLDVEEEFEKPKLTKGATRDTDPQYFTNINGIYAKDAAGRAAVEELRTLVTRTYSETVLFETHTWHYNDIVPSEALTNFDVIVIDYENAENAGLPRGSISYLVSSLFDAQGNSKNAFISLLYIYNTSMDNTIDYLVKAPNLIEYQWKGSDNTQSNGIFISKVIGIKY